jgi:hypothetical protein
MNYFSLSFQSVSNSNETLCLILSLNFCSDALDLDQTSEVRDSLVQPSKKCDRYDAESRKGGWIVAGVSCAWGSNKVCIYSSLLKIEYSSARRTNSLNRGENSEDVYPYFLSLPKIKSSRN